MHILQYIYESTVPNRTLTSKKKKKSYGISEL